MNLNWKQRFLYGFTGLLIVLLAGGFTMNPHEVAADRGDDSFNWLKLEEAQQQASETGKTVFVFVEAEWCGFCRQMEREVFPDERVIGVVNEYYLPVTIDVDSRDRVRFNGEEMTEREFARLMNVRATPTILFIDPEGVELGRQEGYNPTDRFKAVLEFVLSDQFGEIPFEEYMNGRQ